MDAMEEEDRFWERIGGENEQLDEEWEYAVLNPSLEGLRVRYAYATDEEPGYENAPGRVSVFAIDRLLFPTWTKETSRIEFGLVSGQRLRLWMQGSNTYESQDPKPLFAQGTWAKSRYHHWSNEEFIFVRVLFARIPLIDSRVQKFGGFCGSTFKYAAPVCLMVPDQVQSTYGSAEFYEILSTMLLKPMSLADFENRLRDAKVDEHHAFLLTDFRANPNIPVIEYHKASSDKVYQTFSRIISHKFASTAPPPTVFRGNGEELCEVTGAVGVLLTHGNQGHLAGLTPEQFIVIQDNFEVLLVCACDGMYLVRREHVVVIPQHNVSANVLSPFAFAYLVAFCWASGYGDLAAHSAGSIVQLMKELIDLK